MPVNDMIDNDKTLMKILNEIITVNQFVAGQLKNRNSRPKL